MVLHPAQAKIAKDKHRFRTVCAGRRFGKTILAGEEIIGAAVKQDDSVIPYIAPTYRQARDIAWTHFIRRFKPITVDKNESRLEITVRTKTGGQSLIMLRGWENIESLRGQKFPFMVPDEVAMYRNFWEGWQEVLRPALTDLKGGAMFISTPKGFNHFYDLYGFEAEDDDYKSFHFTTYDNPYIPEDEIEKAKLELTEDRFAQEYMADFRKSEGLVYKGFDRTVHTFKKMPEIEVVTTFGGHDFGTNNPCASVTIKKDRDARYWATDEFYKSGLTDAQQADYVAGLKWDKCFPDPESASGILELKNRGVNVREVVKNKDSVRNGINTVSELLATGRLKIHESCRNLIWEFETYRYPERKPDRNEEENPIKENDHALDALRYALTMDNALTQKRYHPRVFKAPKENVNVAV